MPAPSTRGMPACGQEEAVAVGGMAFGGGPVGGRGGGSGLRCCLQLEELAGCPADPNKFWSAWIGHWLAAGAAQKKPWSTVIGNWSWHLGS